MKAIVTHGGILSIEERNSPSPQKGEVKVRIKAVGFNPVDWKMREEWFGKLQSAILGSDASGIVEALGEGVSNFAIGDPVYAMTMSCCSNGSYAEYTCIPEELLCKKPSNLSFEVAAAIPLAAMTAYRMTLDPSLVKKGDAVFIAGAGGGVGGYVVQCAQIAGAKAIYTLAKEEKGKKDLHEKYHIPLENILIYEGLSIEEQEKALLKLRNNVPFDVSLDLVGGPMIPLCIKITKPQGHCATIVGKEDFPEAPCNFHSVYVGQELMNPDHSSWKIYKKHIQEISLMLEKGILKPAPIENLGALSVETVERAHSLLRTSRTKGKLIMSVP